MKTESLTTEQRANIRALGARKPVFGTFFKVLSGRQRNASATELDRFLENDAVPKGENQTVLKREAIGFFRELERIGVGDFRIGRRGMATRFLWGCPLVEVAAAGSDDVQPPATGSTAYGTPASVTSDEKNLVTHTYVLRKELVVRFDLPLDLSRAEAKRLSAFIETLPISDDKEEDA